MGGMETHHQRIKRLIGRDRMCVLLGVKRDAVNVAVAREKFPASWYFIIWDALDKVGEPPSEDDLKFLRAHILPRGPSPDWFTFKVAPE